MSGDPSPGNKSNWIPVTPMGTHTLNSTLTNAQREREIYIHKYESETSVVVTGVLHAASLFSFGGGVLKTIPLRLALQPVRWKILAILACAPAFYSDHGKSSGKSAGRFLIPCMGDFNDTPAIPCNVCFLSQTTRSPHVHLVCCRLAGAGWLLLLLLACLISRLSAKNCGNTKALKNYQI